MAKARSERAEGGHPLQALQVALFGGQLVGNGRLEHAIPVPRGYLRPPVHSSGSRVYGTPPVPRATPLRLEQIGAAHAGVFAAITCAAFRMPDALQPWIASAIGRPGWHHYLALDAGAPVATAAMHVRGDTAWLGIAGTHPLHRRRGAQGALMARRIEDGIALGCTWFVTETSEDTPERPNSSFHNMVRSGFLLAYQRPNYMRP